MVLHLGGRATAGGHLHGLAKREKEKERERERERDRERGGERERGTESDMRAAAVFQ